jgi:uncharacterized protein (DUF433 family)
MPQATAHRYVVTDNQILGGEPIIADTRTPVRAIVELWRQGLAPETIPNRLPHLSLAKSLMPSAISATIRKTSSGGSSAIESRMTSSTRW